MNEKIISGEVKAETENKFFTKIIKSLFEGIIKEIREKHGNKSIVN